MIVDYPPWSVETNTMLSPFFISYSPSPSSSQSASLMRTSMPGRLNHVNKFVVHPGMSKSKLTSYHRVRRTLSDDQSSDARINGG